MDTATLLEEANKYVRFLEAQVTALQTMPERSARFAPPREPPGSLPCPAAALGRLNRQQLLQVLVNSPVVQDRLYARGLCVFSAEQVASLRCSAERLRPPPLLLPPPPPPPPTTTTTFATEVRLLFQFLRFGFSK
uniref:Uncharacterized protein n=1 Tax=Ananas comosus var. bracteatus TaxID=296719 RepID=A0A6V7NKV2_ANACO|nr:unnamed protein product [Ananas comosus var. bracteatus]